MKTHQKILIIVLMMSWVYASFGVNTITTNRLRMRITQHINPSIDINGFVSLGIPLIDSLNVKYGCCDFILVDDHSTAFGRELITFIYSENVIDDNVVSVFRTKCSGLYDFLCAQYQPTPSDPGDYLISNGLNHQQDVLGKIYDDNDSKKYWGVYNSFNYKYQTPSGYVSEWILQDQLNRLDDFVNWGIEDISNQEYGTMLEYGTPNQLYLGTGYQFHGNIGLWQMAKEYNNTLSAWEYTKGKTKEGLSIIALLYDITGFCSNHPDLTGVSLPYLPLPAHDTDHTSHAGHGTKCIGAMAARSEAYSQNGVFDILSSAGVAPEIQVVGLKRLEHFWSIRNALIANGDYSRVKVLSSSITGMDCYDPEMQQMISDGIVPVMARGYNIPNPNYGVYADSPDHLVVGDYMPDYSVKTFFQGNDAHFNAGDAYKASINAPGYIWTTSFNPASPLPDYISQFSYDDPILCFGTNTSIATPQVAGIVALVCAMYPWMTTSEVKRQILCGAHHLQDIVSNSNPLVPSCPPSNFGAGAVNAMSSLFLHGSFTRNFVFSNEINNTTLIGRGFTLNNSSMTVANGILRIEKDANVLLNNSMLVLGDNVTVLFEKGAKLDLCPNSSLVVGNNVTFRTENNDTCRGILLFGNNNQSITFNNSVFINVPIETTNTEVSYNGCTFTRSDMLHSNEPLSINYSSFEFSGLQAIQTIPNPDDLCWIRNTEVSNSSLAGIQITGYSKVKIQNNNIHHNFSGIELYECSGGMVTDNEVSYNGNGLLLYHSNVDITGHNKLTYNYSTSGHGDSRGGYGIDARHLTSWNLIGQNTYPIQIIHDNQREQVLMQSNSIPSSMYYNQVYSSNHDRPYLRLWDTIIGSSRMINISNNNWSSDFIPSRDLSPEPAFTYLPMWEPGIPLQVLEDEAFLLFEEAMSATDNMEYVVAEQKLKQIIAEYPETKVCIDATKQLLVLTEKYNQNYDALELYYTTYPTLRNDPILIKMADYLANFCRMKSENYSEAIQFFEDLILNPPSLPDSLFAVIDAGYAYLLMEQNSDKSSYAGDLKWLKPGSVTAYLNSRNALINNRQLVSSQYNQSTPDITDPIRISNYPNPFNPSTTISFYLPESGEVVLEVFNIKGQRVKTLLNEKKETGSHDYVWNGTDQNGRIVSSGVYFYKISIGTKSIVSKMLLMK